MGRGCAHVAFCWPCPKFRFSNLSFVYSRLALAAFDFYFFNRISHITASAPYICILQLSNPNYLLYELSEHPQNVVVYTQARQRRVMVRGANHILSYHCVSVYSYKFFFSILQPFMPSAYALYFVYALNAVHLGGVCDVRCLGPNHHVDLVHLCIRRRDAILVHFTTRSTSGIVALLITNLCRFLRRGNLRVCLGCFTGETRRASVGYANELPRLRAGLVRDAIKDVVPAALELDDVAALELAHVGVRERVPAELGHGRDEIFQLVLLLELLLRDQVVVVDQRRVDERVRRRGLREPRDLLRRLFEVALEVQLHDQSRDRPEFVGVFGAHDGVSPVHKCDLIE